MKHNVKHSRACGSRLSIDEMEPGERALVERVGETHLSERLRDLGIVSGTEISCLHRAPMGDPTAYMVRGAVIALRRTDGKEILAKFEGAGGRS